MTAKESALLAQMQVLDYSPGMVVTAMEILSRLIEHQNDALLLLYEEHPSEEDFIAYLADLYTKN